MSIEAMKQALGALETKGEHHERVYAAITALRQAIKAAENPDEPPDYVEPVTTDYHEGWEEGFKAGNALAPPKPEQWDTSDMAYRSGGLTVEQEPKAWIYEGNLHIFDPTDWAIEPESVQPLYTAPQKYCPSENNAAYEKGFVEGMAKQTHSSVDRAVNAMTKPWVGLTDEEILSAAEEVPITCIRQRDYDLHFAPIIEAKLKERNT
jgi:hypothetical protein